MFQRLWPLFLGYGLTVPTPSWSYKWLSVGVLTCSQPTYIPGVGPCSLSPSPQDSHCFCLGFFQALVNCLQSSFTNTKCCALHLERRAQSMGGRWYCYTYTNKLPHQGSVVLCLSARSRLILCYLLLFLSQAGWTRPGWLLGCAQLSSWLHCCSWQRAGPEAQPCSDVVVWHPGGRGGTGVMVWSI